MTTQLGRATDKSKFPLKSVMLCKMWFRCFMFWLLVFSLDSLIIPSHAFCNPPQLFHSGLCCCHAASTLVATRTTRASSFLRSLTADWVSLTDNHAVQKRLISPGSGEILQPGTEVQVEYTGRLVGENDWSVSDVIEAWLTQLQGLEYLANVFEKEQIDGSKLFDPDFFTENYVQQTLGVSNKIQCKKLVMAAKRLAQQQKDYSPGTVFDSSQDRRHPFQFVLGSGKAIRAYEIAVATMRKGELAEIKCRSDYAYGAEGYRKPNGDVVVPPFATLSFTVEVL